VVRAGVGTVGAHWKHCSSVSISVFSALEVYLYTTMCYINWHFTYLLTYTEADNNRQHNIQEVQALQR